MNETILYNSAHVLSVTGDRVTFNYKYPPDSLAGAGLVCDDRGYTWANDGPAQECEEYSVRFCCEHDVTETGTTSNLFNILVFRIRVYWINYAVTKI